VFFQPAVDIRIANAQVTAVSQTLLKQMPPGATPPLILNYSDHTACTLRRGHDRPTVVVVGITTRKMADARLLEWARLVRARLCHYPRAACQCQATERLPS